MQAEQRPANTQMRRSASATLAASPISELTMTNRRASFAKSQRGQGHPALGVMQFYQTPFEAAYCDLAKQRNLRKLEALFLEADADGSGEMSLDEFREALRKPWIQRTFSALGVQPHQSELVFRSMVKGKNSHDLRIDAFIEGLTRLVGTSIDGTGRELDIEMLKPTREAKLRRQKTLPDISDSEASRSEVHGHASLSSAQTTTVGLGLGPVHLLPEVTIHRAFIHSAAAKALHPPNTSKRPARTGPD
mmetsp:Transcript_45655/g.132227  ORF Transcript_45655/g.132227 Transcript_45655/m.132227 type:complete len:248 (-) Transcript_45655:122-865(-)